jgi:serine/threonine-protein kinase
MRINLPIVSLTTDRGPACTAVAFPAPPGPERNDAGPRYQGGPTGPPDLTPKGSPMRQTLLLLAAALLPATAARAAEPDPKLTEKALGIIKANCGRCHGPGGSEEDGIDYFGDVPKMIANKKVVPGNPARSRILLRATPGGGMPPEGEQPRPSAADLEVLKTWISALPAAGATAANNTPPPAVKPAAPAERAFVSAADNLEAMLRHLERTPASARRFQRFFTLTNLHNNKKVSDAELRLYQAALAKLLNSLSWKPSIVVPHPVDKEQTVFVIDIRRLDWDRHDLWREVLKAYPYGLRYDLYPDNEAVNETARRLYRAAGTELPAVRADWFIATASRAGPEEKQDAPGLYYTLLRLPNNARALEQVLRVDVCDNFQNNKLARAGFTESGVSRQNRMIERHESAYGAYWKSYDFKDKDRDEENLFLFPLGPEFDGNPFNEAAFKHAGGEIIFNLPNGLQGYMLVDNKDRRINVGPTQIVRDKTETAGSVAIVNGLSCMNCHKNGMITGEGDRKVRDAVRDGSRLGGRALQKVRELYVEPKEMDRLLQEDEDRFVQALDRSVGKFLKVGPDAGKDIRDFPEVIGPVAQRYLLKEVTLQDAALELGLKDPETLKVAIQASDPLQNLGLLPLAQGRTIKREVWEKKAGRLVDSPYQAAAKVLRVGSPETR